MEVSLNQEALEKAQEAVKHMGTRVCTVEAAIRTYLASLPPVDAEPVAWMLKDKGDGNVWLYSRESHALDEQRPCHDLTPLYPAAAIIALQGERDTVANAWLNDRRDWGAKIEAAEAEVARLKAELAEAHRVIEPFADVAEWDIGESETNEDIFKPMDGRYAVVKRITVGDLRRARSFRDGQKTGDE